MPYLGKQPTASDTLSIYKYVATSSQTTFTGADADGATLAYDIGNGSCQVWLNGIRLDRSDVTAADGTSVVLAACTTGDIVHIQATQAFIPADVVPKTAGGTFDGAVVAGAGATVPSGQTLTIASGATIANSGTATGFGAFPKSHIGGLICSRDTDTDHDTNISVGSCRDYADGVDMTLSTTITKQIDVNWAEGDDAGGFPSGLSLAADTRYNVFVIHKTSDGTIDAGYDTSATAANLLSDASGYSGYRLIGSVLTDGSSNILEYIQIGDYVRYDDPVQDIVDNTITSLSFETATVSAPPWSIVDVYGYATNSGGSSLYGSLCIRYPGAADASGDQETWAFIGMSGAVWLGTAQQGQVLTNGSSQVEYMGWESSGTTTVEVRTIGFLMLARSNPV